ncbi:uncharacterized protein LOC115888363 isoform X2 [Sitophilus oryzae]|uniref:Uncharacterized protein LOC115888363 isoform X2 n=1 Tax=Sitophilus oryzae TaxID=7048 RepID=A0A6J2YKW9_SITOR|nr:uncharacterized protein LOC115888363 isoform X2 [Sitophilus oryzae]
MKSRQQESEENKMFYWFNKKCCVPECFNCSTMGDGCLKEYFDLPAESQARTRWLQIILREDGENLTVCEDHFKDRDVFLDKNSRKKLNLNSTPSLKLPKFVCTTCLGTKCIRLDGVQKNVKVCKCHLQSKPKIAKVTVSDNRMSSRNRMSQEQKIKLFKLIKKHGEVKHVKSTIRINWINVLKYSRKHGLLGTEKELRSVWQYLRIKAMRVFKKEAQGSKLERKISRFLHGKGRGDAQLNNSTTDSPEKPEDKATSTSESSDDLLDEPPIEENNITETETVNKSNNEQIEEETKQDEDKVIKQEIKSEIVSKTVQEMEDSGKESGSDSDDEYYSIDDIEKEYGIKLKSETEVILISSDESDWEII